MSTDPSAAGPPTPPPPPPPPAPAQQQPGAPGIAIAGFVCGLVGMILTIIIICFFIGAPLALVGVVLSAIGMKQANETGAKKGLAIAGLVCGIIGVLLGILFTIIAITDDSSDVDFDFESSVVLPALFMKGRLQQLGARLAGAEDSRG
jgi:hypothetical protein